MSEYFIVCEMAGKQYKVLNASTNEIKMMNSKEIYPLSHKFYMIGFNGNTCTDESMHEYRKTFDIWCNELENNKALKIQWKNYHSNYNAVISTFKRLSTFNFKGRFKRVSYTEHEPITFTEYRWSEKCHNGGQYYVEDGIYNGYGYDYSAFYLRLLNSKDYFKIPTKEGYEMYLKQLPKDMYDLKFGYYDVRITCNNPEFRKIFSFSEHHTYTHYSLQLAAKYKEKYNVKIELNTDVKYNCYVYDTKDLIPASRTFGEYAEKILALKELFPKNGLVKWLSSTVWGSISKINVYNFTEQQLDDKNIDIGLDYDMKYQLLNMTTHADGYKTYKLLDLENIYALNTRVKSFITSYGRVKVAKLVNKDIKNVVRVMTDGVVFTKEQIFTIQDNPMDHKTIKPEKKTTGLIELKGPSCKQLTEIDIIMRIQEKLTKHSKRISKLENYHKGIQANLFS